MSCKRGTFKQIIGLYKSYLGSGALVESFDKPKDPILCMHISCPCASYDVNVEPAKDDVLFINVDFVLGSVEKLLKDTYGNIPTKPLRTAASVASSTKPRGFEILLARKREPLAVAPNQTSPIKTGNSRSNCLPAENRHVGDFTANIGSAKEHSMANRQEIRQPNAYLDAMDMLSSPLYANRRTDCARDLDRGEALRDPSVSNPWTFAKINTPIRRLDDCRGGNNQLLTPGYQTGELDEIIGRQVHRVKQGLKPNRHSLPTPRHPHARQHGFITFRSSSPDPYPLSPEPSGMSARNTNPGNNFLNEHSSHGFGSLDSWIQRPIDDEPTISNSSGLDSFDQQDEETSLINTRDFVSARTMLTGSPRDRFSTADENSSLRSSPPESFARGERIVRLNPPDNSLHGNSVRTLSPGKLMQFTPSARCHRDSTSVFTEDQDIECTSQSNNLPSTPYVHPDLAKTLDYELRKQAAVKQWRATQNLRLVQNKTIQTPDSSVPSPHQNRYRRALANLRHPVDDKTEANPAATLEHHDPRAYLIRSQQQDESDEFPLSSRKRRKTSSLPLEKVHEQSTVRDLTYLIDTISLSLSTSAGNCASSGERYDSYFISGKIAPGISSHGLTSGIARAWEEEVKKLLKFFYKTDNNIGELGRMEAKVNIWPLIQTHLAIYP